MRRIFRVSIILATVVALVTTGNLARVRPVSTLLGPIRVEASHNPKLTNASANAAADSVAALMNSGYLRIYDGTQPATADTALSGNNLLAELTFSATAFGASSGGTATANAITSDTDANATGTASFFRIFKSDGTTVVMDGAIGTSASDINLSTTSIVIHTTVSVSAFTYTQSKG